MMRRVVVVSGLSGAGKASILRALEDLGYNAVDNPPLHVLDTLTSRADQPMAIGLDTRSRGFEGSAVARAVARLKATPGVRAELVYAWATEAVLLRRFTETRRRHPLAPSGRVIDGIVAEEQSTAPLRHAADLVIDTSDLPLAELRRQIDRRFRPDLEDSGLALGVSVTLQSFAFPAGLPRDADMVFDARFLRNPHYDPILRAHTGLEATVAAYIAADPDYEGFMQAVVRLMTLTLPRFVQEGKKYVTIAVGCTGGRHRSVHIVERLSEMLRTGQIVNLDALQVAVSHRELERQVGASPASSAEPMTLEGMPNRS